MLHKILVPTVWVALAASSGACARPADLNTELSPGERGPIAPKADGGAYQYGSGDAGSKPVVPGDNGGGGEIPADPDETPPPVVPGPSDNDAGVDQPDPWADTPTTDPKTGLDTRLSVPDGSGKPSDRPGFGGGACGFSEICRIDSQSGGRCEGCTECAGLFQPCAASQDCDILFQCFAGACVPLCDFKTPQTCGAGACLDVGHGEIGVCEATH